MTIPFELKLGVEVETPFGAHKICGYGTTGDKLSCVSFGNSAEPVGYYTEEHGFETKAEWDARRWEEIFAAQPANAQELINLTFAAEFAAKPRHAYKTADKLVNVAIARLIKADKIERKTCGRCGGSGRYSFNLIDRDKCYGCNGSGKKNPTVSEALRALKCE